MAQEIIVRARDDIDGSEADEKVLFALDGVAFEIDLSERNAERLRETLSRFVHAARRVGRQAKSSSGRRLPRRRTSRRLKSAPIYLSGRSDYQKLGSILKDFRKEEEWTQVQLADRLEVPQGWVSKFESGFGSISFK